MVIASCSVLLLCYRVIVLVLLNFSTWARVVINFILSAPVYISLVPSLFFRKEPGTDCLRMLELPHFSGILDILALHVRDMLMFLWRDHRRSASIALFASASSHSQTSRNACKNFLSSNFLEQNLVSYVSPPLNHLAHVITVFIAT